MDIFEYQKCNNLCTKIYLRHKIFKYLNNGIIVLITVTRFWRASGTSSALRRDHCHYCQLCQYWLFCRYFHYFCKCFHCSVTSIPKDEKTYHTNDKRNQQNDAFVVILITFVVDIFVFSWLCYFAHISPITHSCLYYGCVCYLLLFITNVILFIFAVIWLALLLQQQRKDSIIDK